MKANFHWIWNRGEMVEKDVGAYLVDAETGEITREFNEGDRLKIIRSESIEHLRREQLKFNKGKSFVKLYDEVIPYLVDYLSGPELKYILSMAQHISYKDCVLRRTNNNLSDPIKASEFCAIHGYNYSTGKKIFSTLKKKGVIAYVETGTILSDYVGNIDKIYLVNPYIYFRGCEINETAKSVFDRSGWKEKIIATN